MKKSIIEWEEYQERKLRDRKDYFLVICTDGEQLWVEKSYYHCVTGWEIEEYLFRVIYYAEMPFPDGEPLEAIK